MLSYSSPSKLAPLLTNTFAHGNEISAGLSSLLSMVYPFKSRVHIEHAVSEARKAPSKRLNIEFGSLTAFAMSDEGVHTLQADQLNVIAHHLHTIKTEEDLWTDKSDWPLPIDSPDVMTERLKIRA